MADGEPLGNQEGVDTGRPDWLESNFTSVEAQAKAYADARREMHQTMSRAQELEQQAQQWQEYAAELEAQQQPQFGQDALSNPLLLQLRQAREMGDDQTELALTAFIANQIADQKINERMAALENGRQDAPDETSTEMYALLADQTAREKYDAEMGPGAWDDIKRDAAQLLIANPDLMPETLSPMQAAERLVFAAKHVQGQKMLTATEQERNQQAQARQQRLMAQGLRQSGATPPTVETPQEAWQRIQNAPAGSYAELRNQ